MAKLNSVDDYIRSARAAQKELILQRAVFTSRHGNKIAADAQRRDRG